MSSVIVGILCMLLLYIPKGTISYKMPPEKLGKHQKIRAKMSPIKCPSIYAQNSFTKFQTQNQNNQNEPKSK